MTPFSIVDLVLLTLVGWNPGRRAVLALETLGAGMGKKLGIASSTVVLFALPWRNISVVVAITR